MEQLINTTTSPSLNFDKEETFLNSTETETDTEDSMTLVDNYPHHHDGEIEENGFIWVHRPHPMCIPHIVDNILGYLTVTELKSCRLVNSQYNEIGCRNLSRKEVITFNKMAHISSYLSLMPISSQTSVSSKTLGINKITAAADAADNNPPHKEEQEEDAEVVSSTEYNNINSNAHLSYHFNFDPDCNSDDTDEAYDTLLRFFDTLGPYIKKLHYTTDLIPFNFPKQLPHLGDIWKNRMESLEILSLEMKWGIPSVLFEKENGLVTLPLVKTLILDILVTEREADRAAIFLKQLLLSTPNVEEITIPGNKKFFDDYINVVLARIILSMDLPRLAKLNFCLALDEIQIRTLAEKNFPLKSLILDFAEMQYDSFPIPPNNNNDENNNNNVLNHPFFQNQMVLDRSLRALFIQTAPTLSDLHLSFPYNSSHPLHRFTFPEPMMKLGHFALGGFYGSVEILEKLPAIKKLDLWNVRFHDFDYDVNSTGANSSSDSNQPEEIKEKQQIRPRIVPKQYVDITTMIS